MTTQFKIGDTCLTQAGFHFVIASFDGDFAIDTAGYLCPVSRLELYRAA